MTKRGRGKGPAPGGLPAIYEGPEVLTALLRRAGSPTAADEVARLFKRAIDAGEDRSAVIPTLFPAEPRFASPDDARRLYGNLFGLWARLAAGLGAHEDAPDVLPDEPPVPPLASRGSVPGSLLPASLVEATWKALAAAAPREAQRRRDTFQNAQPDLAGWLDAVPLPDSGTAAAQDLVFEAWAMMDQAFGERVRAVEFRDLRAITDAPPPVEETQPALAAYVAEQLDMLADEDPKFGPEERAQVERVVSAAVATLTDAVQEPS